MEEKLDFSTQKSVNEMIERAKIEREKALHLVEFFQSTRVPSVFLNIRLTIQHLNEISTKLEVNPLINEDDYMKLEQACIDTLNKIKEQLENIKFTEEELLTTDVIGETYSALEKISNKLDDIPVKLLEKGKVSIFEGITKKEEERKLKAEADAKLLEEKEKEEQEERKKQREEQELRQQKLKEQEEEKNIIIEEINELEKQKMLLKGRLDASIFGKKELRQQISELEEKIEQRRGKLDTLKIDEKEDVDQKEESEDKNVEAVDKIKLEKDKETKVEQNLDSKKQEDETIEF